MLGKGNKFNIILALVLTFSLLAGATGTALADKDKPPKADPRLLQMAEENPDAIFMVIVQKEAKNKDLKDMELEGEVTKGGGQVKKQLDLIVSFLAEVTGKELTKLARHPKTRWISADAPMTSSGGPGMETVRDQFDAITYSANHLSENWSSDWQESMDDNSPSAGKIRISNPVECETSGKCLIVKPSAIGAYVYRQVDLSNAVIATLSFDRNNTLDALGGTAEEVKAEVSPDGGLTWFTLQTYSSTTLLGTGEDSFDITPYMSEQTQVRFLVSDSEPGLPKFIVDNIQIEFARASAFVSAVKADQLSLDGSGVAVAVIDSGIGFGHPDFHSGGSSRVITSQVFGSHVGPADLFGHGTHVAGIIGGDGSASNGEYTGVAPGVDLINLKVSDKDGMTYESSVVESLQWVYDNKDTYNIRVVNLSMNSSVAQSYHTSPLSAAVEILWFNGIVVVVSAGNNGTGEGPVTLYPPANDPFVITVGATEDHGTSSLGDDNLANFSAYGITEDGFAKPDLVAPGRNLVAPLAAKATTVYEAHPKHRVDDNYFRMSGTSMSAPIVTGAVALLLQDEPGLYPDQVKYRLMATASQNDWDFDDAQAGAGYLDAYAAVTGSTDGYANQGIMPSLMLATGEDGIDFASVGWNTVGWNTVGWNTVGWNTVGWNTVGWNTVGWNTVGWNTTMWDD